LIGVAGAYDTIVIKGNFSTASGTITITKYLTYIHEGVHTVTGNFAAVTMNIPQGTLVVGKAGNAIYVGAKVFIKEIAGPADRGVGFASSAGIRFVFSSQCYFHIQQIHDFNYGYFFDYTNITALDQVADCLFMNPGVTFCNYAVRVVGGSPRKSEEGNVFVNCNFFGCNHGVVIDSTADISFSTWTGAIDNVFQAGSDNWVNNASTIVGTSALTTQLLLFEFLRSAAGNVFQNGDFLFAAAGASYGTVGLPGTRTLRIPRLTIVQRQLAVGFTAATSIAVIFPEAEQDTNYSVYVEFAQNSGAYWITAKSTTGCTINWATSSTGSLDYFVQR
jgi:hypothetical protein